MKGFVNPYNFIGFPQEKAKAYTDTDVHTGMVQYTITTKTPLFIPNSSSDKAFVESDQTADHKSYDFFSYTEMDPGIRYENEYPIPVIPGSEIRGVVRSVYETLTDSCMGMLNSEKRMVKRSAEQFSPALIYRDNTGKMSLYRAKSLRIGEESVKGSYPRVFEDDKNGTVFYYKEPERNQKNHYKPITEYSRVRGKYKKTGYLIKWGMGVKKKRYHLYSVSGKECIKDIDISRDIIERKLFPILESYLSQPGLSQENKRAYEEYSEDLKAFLHGDAGAYFPVNYSELNKGIYYLAPSIFSKEVSENKTETLADVFAPCRDDYCPACDLFGYVGKNNEFSRGSKIRFSDLYTVGEKSAKDYYLNGNSGKVTLQTLGEPKLGNVDFYLKRPYGADFWTYDYYTSHGRTEIEKGTLRGRKYYWHHRKVNTSGHMKASHLNKTIRPVRENIVFEGSLYFENISEKQLKQLIWILNSGTEKLGLKLGGAKPLGYGSISCKVEQVLERKIQMSDTRLSYVVQSRPVESLSYEDVGFSNCVRDEFYKISDFTSVPEGVEITYPKTVDQKGKSLTEGYCWFVENHKNLAGKGMPTKRTEMKIRKVLPTILEEDFSLPYYVNYQKKKNSGKKTYSGNAGGNRKGKN